ncbi:MAG TPA: nitrite/sulfite reductase [Geobacteraceae bacterium]
MGWSVLCSSSTAFSSSSKHVLKELPMALDAQQLRIEGIYQQKGGRYMQRIKLAAGVISVAQAEVVANLATGFADGLVHLTTRGSMELHGIEEVHIAEIARQLAAVGLTSRGACGGAVRGISCSTAFAPEYPQLQVLVRKLHHYFTQNPHFEGLPKKFKISVEAGYAHGHHLIQDVSLVYWPDQQAFDVWVAGGLGKEPHPAFLLSSAVTEDQVIPLLEDIANIYKEHAPKGRRLKHLVREIGQDGFCTLLTKHRSPVISAPLSDGFPKGLLPTASTAEPHHHRLELPIFAGQLTAQGIRTIACLAKDYAGGFLVVTTNQNIALFFAESEQFRQVSTTLQAAGMCDDLPEQRVVFRICPGNHECRMGLVATRDLAKMLIKVMGPAARKLTWAISGCHNSCSQPQLADMGIFVSRLIQTPAGSAQPFFTVLRRLLPTSFATMTAEHISQDELLAFVARLS